MHILPKNVRVGGAIIAAALFASFQPATAQVLPTTPVTTPVSQGFFFWSAGAEVGVRFLPKFSYGKHIGLRYGFDQCEGTCRPDVTDMGDLFSFNPKPVGAGPTFVMGLALNRESFLGDVGNKPRVEIAVASFFGSQTQRSSARGTPYMENNFVTTFEDFLFPTVDGRSFVPFLAQDLTFKLDTTAYTGEFGIRFKTQFQVSPTLMIVPSIAAIGGVAHYRYKLEGNAIGGGVNTFSMGGDTAALVKETINSFHFGAEGGLSLVWQAMPNLMIQGGLSLGGFHRNAHLDASNNFMITSLSNYAMTNNSSDQGNTWGYRFGMSASASYSWGWARITVTGFGFYDSAIPGVRNPSISNPFSGPDGPASVRFDGQWAYGGRVEIVFPLN